MSSDDTFLSHNSLHKPKDLNSSINCNSTLCTIDPIHSGSEVSFLSLKQKLSPPKPAFGTSSNRVINQFEGHKQSDIVAYSRINYQKDEKYQNRYEELKTKPTPFLSTCGRFNANSLRYPGPGQYSIPEAFQPKSQKNPKQNPMFCPFKRWESQQTRSPFGTRWQERAYLASLKNKQNVSPVKPYELQQKIKEKREEIKEKMMILKEKMKKPKKTIKNQMKSMGFSDKDKMTPRRIESPEKKSAQTQKESPAKILNLREVTAKYLPKLNYEFEREEYRTVAEMKSFKETFNHQAVFLSKNDSVYRSYIPKNENPGPGHYEKRTKKTITRRLSSKMSQFFDLE